MDPPAVRSRGRPRKRRKESENTPAPDSKKRVVEMRSMAFVGRYVLKEFADNGIFLGKVVHYDEGLYRVNYEDGDSEDLESGELRGFILNDSDFDDDLSRRKKKLDELVVKISEKLKRELEKKASGSAIRGDNMVEVSTLSEVSGGLKIENDGAQVEGDADSSSDSCEYARDRDSGFVVDTTPAVPPLELPPSSGTIGVPEQYVSYLFSVYGFLRSFSIRLFLSPFTLDDFVGSLNCCDANTLLDAIHVALMRALRRHLEKCSSDGLEIASKCLRCIDWSLLDTLTWPVYLVHYLTVMGYTKGPEWKGFYDEVLSRDYCSLPAGRKLMILQILCDDVLESEEIRAEIDMREESEVGLDHDAEATNPPANGPRRVHPRYSKTSACKDREAMEIIAETHGMKSLGNSSSLGFKGTKQDVDADDVDVDRNGDECRLCGMDGILLCCDGCPSAYHSRCIGVMKTFIPEGPWYCPECTVNKIGPTITTGTSLTGAEIFGIDSYERIFLGTCNHLLVLKASLNTEPCFRYYNQKDIAKVLQVLCSSVQHTALYMGVCKAILQYWAIPDGVLSLPEMNATKVNNAKFSTLSCPPFGKEDCKVLESLGAENYVNNENPSIADNMAASCLVTSLDTTTRTDLPGPHSNGDTRWQEWPLMEVKLTEGIKMESAISTGSVSQQADPSDLTYQSLIERSSAIDLTTCTSGNSNGSYTGHGNCISFPVNLFFQNKEGNRAGSGKGGCNSVDDFVYLGSFHKPQAYINHYMHGDFSASAAAKLAVLSSEEARVSDAHASENSRKVASSNNLLQAKAFSSTASRFFWPSSEKKLVEVPRERCGWCLSCKAPVSSKRGCMLNHACLSATKGAMKILAGLRPIKSGDGYISSITTYILYMEESLCGLIVGPFLSASYRKQWHKQVEQASTCSEIKALLLELEKNIHTIALSGDWVKLVDDLLVESSVIQSVTCNVGTTQKRGLSGRRNRKQSAMSEVSAADCHDKSFHWWQGGKVSKLIFQKAILPCSMVKKAARQGGRRKISGIYYADSSEVPKRSRQLVWRAAVEMCKNAAQLALQVRYLDFHLRWSELLRPEQNLQDGKGLEAEASAFRNAVICDKKFVENKITYAVAFGSQKHFPSRVMKSIIEIEQSQDGKHKFWFSESRIPLYLIKEYEESVDKVLLPSAEDPLNVSSKLHRKRLKAFRRDVFFYLTCKRDNLDMGSCSSCQLDVLIGNAVKCSACQGYCHKDCSKISRTEEFESLITCKQCYHAKGRAHNNNSYESPISPLPLQGREHSNSVTVTKGTRPKCNNQPTNSVTVTKGTRAKCNNQPPLASIRTQDTRSELKQASSDSSLANKNRRRQCSWGIIWRKKNNEDTGIDFRLKNILLRGSLDVHRLEPVCHLCHKPYMADLMYICCDTCKNWYHAEAVALEESKFFDVVGFKCCRCRRIRSPVCPYMDHQHNQPEGKKTRLRATKQEIISVDSDYGIIPESQDCDPTTVFSTEEVPKQEYIECGPATSALPMEEVSKQEYDPLFPLSKVELITAHNSELDIEWNATSGPGPQKLPVRRHVKREEDIDGFSGSNLADADFSTHTETNNFLKPAVNASSPQAEWDLQSEMMLDYEGFNYEDMEFEPQTYFSVTELLASDDGGAFNGVDTSGDWSGYLENPSSTILQDEVPKQYGIMDVDDQPESANSVKPAVNMIHCQQCFCPEPAPDLSCQNCGLQIHRKCSPWVESSSGEDSWSCGNCRDWR